MSDKETPMGKEPMENDLTPEELESLQKLIKKLEQGRSAAAASARKKPIEFEDEVVEFAVSEIEGLLRSAQLLAGLTETNAAGAFIQAPLMTILSTLEIMRDALLADEEELNIPEFLLRQHESWRTQLLMYFQAVYDAMV